MTDRRGAPISLDYQLSARKGSNHKGDSMQAETSQSPIDEGEPSLTISPEKVCFIIVKAREFDAKDEVTEPDPGSNPSDDKD